MTYGDAPAGAPVPPDAKDMVMHTAMPLGSITLMGCDACGANSEALGGFQVSVESSDPAEVKRLFAALSEGGSVKMPLNADLLVALVRYVQGQVRRWMDGQRSRPAAKLSYG